MADSTQDCIHDLVWMIKTAADNIESHYKACNTKPFVPHLDETEPHPLDAEIYPLGIKDSLRMLEGACAQLCSMLARPNHTMMVRFLRSVEPACIGVALRARVADILLEAPEGMPIAEIGKRCGLEWKKLGRVLRVLCSTHVFREVRHNVFANNRLSIQLVSSSPMWSIGMHLTDEPNIKGAAFLADTLFDPNWGFSSAAEHSPFSFSSGYPGSLYEFFEDKGNAKGIEQGTRFGRAMIGFNEATDAAAIVTGFPWKDLSNGTTVADLAGGVGYVSMQLYRKYPNLLLKLHDLPERIQQAESEIWPQKCPQAIVEGKIEFRAVDLSSELPAPGCDVYLLKSIVHNLSNEVVLRVLTNVSKVMKPTSRLLIDEYIVRSPARVPGDDSEFKQAPMPLLPNFGVGDILPQYLDIAMLVQVNSEERTLEEYLAVGQSAGLRFVKLWDLGGMSILEFSLA